MKLKPLHVSAFLLLLFFPLSARAQTSDFVGEWKIRLVKQPRPGTEIRYAVKLSIRLEQGQLAAYYTDAEGNTEKCSDFVVSQNEIFFRTGPAGKKNVNYFGPVHRAILKNGELRGFTFTERKEFDWVGKRM